MVAITVTLVPRSSQGHSETSAERPAKRVDSRMPRSTTSKFFSSSAKNAAVHRGDRRHVSRVVAVGSGGEEAALRGERLDHLSSAVKFDKADKRARHELLDDAMNEDLIPDSLYWAKEVLKLEPDDPDAHFVLAVDALEGRTPNVPEARRHLKVLEDKKAPLVRRLWIRARLADATGDAAARGAAFAQAASLALPADCPPIDRITWLRIITLQIRNETDPAKLGGQVQAMLRPGEAVDRRAGARAGPGRPAAYIPGADAARA